MADHMFLKKWKKEQVNLIKLAHPEWDSEKIKEILDKKIDKTLKNPECALVNNYINVSARTTLLDLYDYIDLKKPIIAGGGVLFKNQHQAINPPSIFLDGALKKRKSIKKGLKTAKPGSYEYMMIDLRQLTEKVVANSYYGASGNETSPFYNLFTALATTATGQALISCMMCAFESFYSNNVKFYNIDDALLYIRNSLKKKVDYVCRINDMPKISVDDLLTKFESMFKSKDILKDLDNRRILELALSNLSSYERQVVYYSSNLFAFIEIPSIKQWLVDIVYMTESFKDPNDPPKNTQEELDKLWLTLQAWVVYNYPVYNRINRLKFEKRKVVVTIDTDSNMLNISKFMKFMKNATDNSKTITGDFNEIMYIHCNMMCYILTRYSQVVLAEYAKIANIPDEYAPRLNMKNEFLYLRMILGGKKKSYCGIVRLREGVELIPEKLDVKGLQFIKSTANSETRNFCLSLAKEILYAEEISGSYVLKRMKEFARYIENSLLSGEKKFLNPLSVKEPEAYDKPFSNQGIRGTYVWNSVYPDMQIQLPDKITVVKVNMEKLENIDSLMTKHPDIYKKLCESVYLNKECGFASKGISVIAIPSQVTEVPEWIRPFIDKDKIINDNLTKFHMVLESLGVQLLDTRSNNPHFSNIVNF